MPLVKGKYEDLKYISSETVSFCVSCAGQLQSSCLWCGPCVVRLQISCVVNTTMLWRSTRSLTAATLTSMREDTSEEPRTFGKRRTFTTNICQTPSSIQRKARETFLFFTASSLQREDQTCECIADWAMEGSSSLSDLVFMFYLYVDNILHCSFLSLTFIDCIGAGIFARKTALFTESWNFPNFITLSYI